MVSEMDVVKIATVRCVLSLILCISITYCQYHIYWHTHTHTHPPTHTHTHSPSQLLSISITIYLNHYLSQLQPSPSQLSLYATGFFYFAVTHLGSDVADLARVLRLSHLSQRFRGEADARRGPATPLGQRSYLGHVLPEASGVSIY